MNGLCGLGAAPAGLPWPDSACAVWACLALASGGNSSEPRTPHPARPIARNVQHITIRLAFCMKFAQKRVLTRCPDEPTL